MKSSIAITLGFSLSALIALAGCKATSPALTGPMRQVPPVQYAPPTPDPKSQEFGPFVMKPSTYSGEQKRYDENIITVQFTVQKDGKSVNNLTERDFSVSESGVPVPKFQVAKNVQELNQVAEIALVVDVTNSMGPFIEAAKKRLTSFVATSLEQKRHVRVCLSTFGDFVVKKCDRFYDITKPDELADFKSDLNSIAIKDYQGEIKPYIDVPENPMRAIVSALTSTEWQQSSQRFLIVVTDADFYTPDKTTYVNKGKTFPTSKLKDHQACTGCQPGQDTSAPSMAEVHQAIEQSQAHIFAITPADAGYNSPLAGLPAIVKDTKPQHDWFLFQNVINGESIGTILNNILREINTTYTLTYSVEKNGLNPTLSVDKRIVGIKTAAGDVTAKPATGLNQTGRDKYKTTWSTGSDPIRHDSVVVKVNGRQNSLNEYSVNGSEVTFTNVPPPGAKIEISYEYEDIGKNLHTAPITLNGQVNARNTKVFLNNTEARPEDVVFSPTSDGDTNLKLADSAMASNDPYLIRRNQGVTIRVISNYAP
jgi:hypothetical protein